MVARQLATSDIFVWPGTGEAYGIAYLEAQASGLPVVAQATAGVPTVVRHGVTGLLTAPQDDAAFAAAGWTGERNRSSSLGTNFGFSNTNRAGLTALSDRLSSTNAA